MSVRHCNNMLVLSHATFTIFSEDEGDPLEDMEDKDGEFVKKDNSKREEKEKEEKKHTKNTFPGIFHSYLEAVK